MTSARHCGHVNHCRTWSCAAPGAIVRACIWLAVLFAGFGGRDIFAAPITQQAYLKASNTGSNDVFGLAVALSRDTLVVGAPQEAGGRVNGDQSDNSAFAAGAVYIFVRHGTQWVQQAYLKASNPD